MKTLRLIFVGLVVSVAGCQTGQTVQTSALENGSFMSLWSSYSRCQAITNIDELRADAATLTHAANRSLSHEAFILPLPSDLQQFVSTPAARLAVDVKAMAAACALRAGSAAIEAGKTDVAKDLLRTIINYQSQPEYAYYVLQAKALLSELERELETNNVQVSLGLPWSVSSRAVNSHGETYPY
jgi:hypothetical protein